MLCIPIAHFAVQPIKRLRKATLKSIATYEVDDSPSTDSLVKINEQKVADTMSPPHGLVTQIQSHSTSTTPKPTIEDCRRMKQKKVFKIPETVPDRKHLINDELTELTGTFNEMSDELKIQYSRLEERVKARTIELEQSRNAARAASESKTLFIANISHELRTPLNGIIGMCTIAIQESSLQRVRQSLKIIYKSSDLLLHLLNDLITFSRNSYGQRLALEDSIFRLSDIKTQLLSIFERQAREAKIDLRVLYLDGMSEGSSSDVLQKSFSPGDPTGVLGPDAIKNLTLRGDKNRLLQILMNLVSNSLKFTSEQGVIEVRIRFLGAKDKTVRNVESPEQEPGVSPTNQNLTVQLAQPNRRLSLANRQIILFKFEVEDTGSGVPEELQQEIFKPFVQGDAGLSKKHGGTGLGLAICAQLASLMGGTIVLKSTVGIGSTFTLSLPFEYTREQTSSLPASLAGSLQSPSKPNSILSSLRDEFPADARRRSSPGRRSMRSNRRTDSSEIPRVVGFSNPYITDGDSACDDETLENPPTSYQPMNRVNSRDKDELLVPKIDTPRLRRKAEAEPARYSPRKPSSPIRRPGTPTKSVSSGALGLVKTSRTSAQDQTSSNGTKLRVLVAEDNKVNQEVIKRMLRLEKVTGKCQISPRHEGKFPRLTAFRCDSR